MIVFHRNERVIIYFTLSKVGHRYVGLELLHPCSNENLYCIAIILAAVHEPLAGLNPAGGKIKGETREQLPNIS